MYVKKHKLSKISMHHKCSKWNKFAMLLPALLGPSPEYSSSTETRAHKASSILRQFSTPPEIKQNFAEPNVVHSKVECPIWNAEWVYEHIVLTIGCP